MRVAVVVGLPDARNSHLYILASRLVQDMLLVTSTGSTDWPIDVHRAPRRSFGGALPRQWISGLEKTIRQYRPDVIHVHTEPWALSTLRMLRLPVPVVVHGAENIISNAPWPYRARRLGTSHALRKVSGYASWGWTGLRAAQAAGLPTTTPSAVIPASPPDPSTFQRMPIDPLSGDLRVIFVGRLVPEKGADVLVRAIAASGQQSRIALTVVGAGPQTTLVSELARRHNVRARFTGKLAPEEVHRELARAHVLVAPSLKTPTWEEQWGRCVAEAMMTGRPVIVSDSGELPWLVRNDRWVVPAGDYSFLARALMRYLDDPASLLDNSHAAYAMAAGFEPNHLARTLVDLWGRARSFYVGRAHQGD